MISLKFTEFFNKAEFSNYLSYFFLVILMLKLDQPDPDPGSQNLADPHPDPKHCLLENNRKNVVRILKNGF